MNVLRFVIALIVVVVAWPIDAAKRLWRYVNE